MKEILAVILATFFMTGCAAVNPWEREILADRTMNYSTEMDESALDHFYSAREGSAGGFGSGGGGCGCN